MIDTKESDVNIWDGGGRKLQALRTLDDPFLPASCMAS